MSRLSEYAVLDYPDYHQQFGSRKALRRRLLGISSFLLVAGFFYSTPVAFVDGEPGLQRPAAASLDDCQTKFAEALELRDREREYHADKARYTEAVASRCGGEKWYHLDLLECILFVPVFGLFLPFFGFIFISTLRSIWKPSSSGGIEEEAEIADAP